MNTRSPTLTEEELTFALHAYLQVEESSLSPESPPVRWLSQVLRQLPIHGPEDRPEETEFRSPEGLARRLRELEDVIQDQSDPPLEKYRSVWAKYRGKQTQLENDVERLLDRHGARATMNPAVQEEIDRRREIWEELLETGPDGVDGDRLRTLDVYRGQAGIWVDKQRTGPFSEGGEGITVSVMHTGEHYPDDLRPGELIYHYPDTGRPEARDQVEIAATKNACRIGVPIFLVLPGSGSGRSVRLGRVVGWDDPNQQFLILYGTDEEVLLGRLAERRRSGEDMGLNTDLPDNWTEIDHLKRPNQSAFYDLCQSILQEVGNELQLKKPLKVTFEADKGGFPDDERVEIGGPDEKTFQTDWDGSDPTRFPARIRAAATALRDEGWRGTYRIRHEAGSLQIAPAETRDNGNGSPAKGQTTIFDQPSARSSGGNSASDEDTATQVRDGGYAEGRARSYNTTRYERDPKARQACIDHYGAECYICGFDFGEVYGKEWSSFIEVHHETPVSEVGPGYEVDPIENLKPLCPNCHAMVHKRTPPYTPDEVRRMMSDDGRG